MEIVISRQRLIPVAVFAACVLGFVVIAASVPYSAATQSRSNSQSVDAGSSQDSSAYSFAAIEAGNNNVGSALKSTQLSDGESLCEMANFTKQTLKPAFFPRPFAGLFRDLKGQRKFEASDIVHVTRNGVEQYFVVFDNLFAVGRVGHTMSIHDESNALVGLPGVDSGYEAIVYDNVTDNFLVTIEALTPQRALTVNLVNPKESQEGPSPSAKEMIGASPAQGPPFYAVVREMKIPVSGDVPVSAVQVSCPVAYPFSHENKGFEGMMFHRSGGVFLLGLCEGNFCSGGKRGRQTGNGRLIVLRYQDQPAGGATEPKQLRGSTCLWVPVLEIALPKTANFQDYSAVSQHTLPDGTQLLAVASQENAAVWIGEADFRSEDPRQWTVGDGHGGGGTVYHLPRDGECRVTNCNLEGIYWVGRNILAGVSDKMKSGGRQDFRCFDADQSMQMFVLP